MGGTASTRRVTFEADENENITVVKGIRLSENVIDRMKESSTSGSTSSTSGSTSQRYSSIYGASDADSHLCEGGAGRIGSLELEQLDYLSSALV